MAQDKDRNKRISELINNKMRFMFKEVLTSVETETKEFDINPEFFAKNKQKAKGFYAIRKTMFDQGNAIIDLVEIILGQLELTPVKSIITVDPNVMKEEK